jgi:hypothetical protein
MRYPPSAGSTSWMTPASTARWICEDNLSSGFATLDILSDLDTSSNSPFTLRGVTIVTEVVAFNIKDFPDDLHRQIRIDAAVRGETMKEWLIRVCRDALDQIGDSAGERSPDT